MASIIVGKLLEGLRLLMNMADAHMLDLRICQSDVGSSASGNPSNALFASHT